MENAYWNFSAPTETTHFFYPDSRNTKKLTESPRLMVKLAPTDMFLSLWKQNDYKSKRVGEKQKDNLKNKDVKKKRELIFKMNLQWTCKQGYGLLRKDIWGLNSDRTKENFPVITFLEVHFSPEFSTLSQHTDSYTAWDFWAENKALPKVTCRTRVRAYVKGKRGIRTLQLYNTQTTLQKGAGTSVTLACSVWQRK